MDTLAGSVLAGALADVVATTTARIARAADPFGKAKSKRSRRLLEKLRTLDLLETLQTVEILNALAPEQSMKDVTSALQTPQGKASASQIVASRIVSPGSPVPAQVTHTISLQFAPPNQGLAEAITAAIAAAVDDCLARLEEVDHEAAQDLRQTAGASLIASTLQSVHSHAENAALYTDPHRIAALGVWEQKYRSQMRIQHGHIVPPDFEQKRKVPLDDLYVAPKLRKYGATQSANEDSVDIETFHADLDRSVLLGDPGGGKSTASAWIATTAANNPEMHVPFIVTLRDYAREPNSAISIAEFIEQQASAFYQCKPPAGAVEYLLSTGRALVIFDGLDELLETSRRREMTNRVESFCHNYPQAPILVTSRRVGYAEAALDPTVFVTFSIGGFDASDVRQYVKNWFKHVDDQGGDTLKATCESFLAEARDIRDLTATPLILSLLCIIYRGQGYMPKNRPLVYEKCANLLFERWDSSRQIDVSLRVASQVDNAMKHLALWMLTSDRSGGGVLRDELINEAAEFLSKVVEDDTECRAAAVEFVDFCKGRAWVLSDAGTTAEGEELYKFTHRTFMEYFAAYELTRESDGPEALAKTLLPKVARGEWDVVAQLAVQIMDKGSTSGAERVLRRCLEDRRRRTPQGRDNILGFIWRCLSFVRVGEGLIRDLIERSLNSASEYDYARARSYTEPCLAYAVAVMPEALQSVSRLFEEALTARLKGPTSEVRRETALLIASWADDSPTAQHPVETMSWWRDWVKKLVLAPGSPMLGLDTDMAILHGFFTRRMITLDEFVGFCEERGQRAGDYLFTASPAVPYGYRRIGWASILVNMALFYGRDDATMSVDEDVCADLEAVARHFPASAELPFANAAMEIPFWFSLHNEAKWPVLESSSARWGLCVLVMMLAEDERSRRAWQREGFQLFDDFIRARRGDQSGLASVLEVVSLEGSERELIERWAAGDVSLTSPRG